MPAYWPIASSRWIRDSAFPSSTARESARTAGTAPRRPASERSRSAAGAKSRAISEYSAPPGLA